MKKVVVVLKVEQDYILKRGRKKRSFLKESFFGGGIFVRSCFSQRFLCTKKVLLSLLILSF